MLKKTISLLTTGLLLVGMLSACVTENPQAEPSMNRDTEQMIATAAQPSNTAAGQTLRETLGVPERVEETLPTSMDKFSVSISADVSVPDADHLPVYRVNAAEFSQEFIAKAYDYFCKNETMYYFGNLTQTKDQIQGQIGAIQRDLDSNQSPNGSEDKDGAWRTDYEAEIARLKAELPNAPEDLGAPITKAQLTQQEAEGDGTYDSLMAVDAPQYPYTIEFFVRNNVKYPTDEVRYIESTDTTVAPHSEANFSYRDLRRVSLPLFKLRDVTNETQTAELTTTPPQAMERVTALFDQLGIRDMEPYRICLAQEYTEDGTTGKCAYYVMARRVVDGIEVQSPFNRTYIGGLDGGKEWAYETLSVRLDSEGIIGMNWVSPLTLGAVEVARANLLPFSSILTVAKNMLTVVNEPKESDLKELDAYSIEINHITLSLQRIPDANSIESGLLIPVWNFYGQTHLIPPNRIEAKTNIDMAAIDAIDEPYLSINAIDGTIIDRTTGY